MSKKTESKAPSWHQEIGEASLGWSEVAMPFNTFARSFVSGDPDSRAIRIRYYQHPDHPGLGGVVYFGPDAEGPPGHVHGGAQAAVLDEMCGGVAWLAGHPVVAVNLAVDFRRMVPLLTTMRLFARLLRTEGRKVFTEGTMAGDDGQIHAEAKGIFVMLEAASIESLGASLTTKR